MVKPFTVSSWECEHAGRKLSNIPLYIFEDLFFPALFSAVDIVTSVTVEFGEKNPIEFLVCADCNCYTFNGYV